jgi:hypothetical protein
VRPRAFTPIADPLRLLGWESRNRAAVGSDTLCRLSAPQWAFHNPPLLASTHRKTHRDVNRQTRAADPPYPLGNDEPTTQDAFDWLDLTFQRGRPTGKRNRSLPSVRAPSSRVPRTGPVRVPDPLQNRYPVRLDATNDARSTSKMPLANHLQPTCCHVYPARHSASKLGGSRPSDHRASTTLPAGWVTCSPRRFNAPALTSPCGRHQPWMVVVWCPNDQPKPLHRPFRDARCPRQSPRWPCRPYAS